MISVGERSSTMRGCGYCQRLMYLSAQFKSINQLCVDWPQLSLMHGAPFWLQREISDRQQGSNVTLGLFEKKALWPEGRLVAGLALAICWGMWMGRDYEVPALLLGGFAFKRRGWKGHFETWSPSTFRGKEHGSVCWDEPRHKTAVWPFLPTSVLLMDSKQDRQKCSWWIDSIRKESNCIIILSTGPLSRVHPISCS